MSRPAPQYLRTDISRTAALRWAELYASGMSVRDISDSSGWSVFSVHTHLRGLGVKMRKDLIPASEPPDYAARYMRGETLLQIGRHFGRSPNSVWTHLRDRGVTMRPPGRRPR